MKAVVLDASAFIQGYNLTAEAEYYTVYEVRSEIRDAIALLRFEGAVDSGRLTVVEPHKNHLEAVEALIRSMGESKLSLTDRKLLALCLELKASSKDPQVISDDYSVQNMVSRLNLTFSSQTTKGIGRRFTWVTYCPGCRRKFENTKEKICPVCGTSLKRKPDKKISI